MEPVIVWNTNGGNITQCVMEMCSNETIGFFLMDGWIEKKKHDSWS